MFAVGEEVDFHFIKIIQLRKYTFCFQNNLEKKCLYVWAGQHPAELYQVIRPFLFDPIFVRNIVPCPVNFRLNA